jgi:acyl carrier protein
MKTWQGFSPGQIRCDTSAMRSREEIFNTVRTALIDLFELEAPIVVLEARFNDDLEIDSIDAVDLVDHLSRIFDRRVSPRDFRAVRTVQDLIDTIDRLQTQ